MESFPDPHAGGRAWPPHALPEGLHICRRCGSTLVQPVDWAQLEEDWSLALLCPECGLLRTGVWSEAQLERLEAALEHAALTMAHDCEALARARHLEEIERFAAALESGELGPADFERS